jgi:hypothetical protein
MRVVVVGMGRAELFDDEHERKAKEKGQSD